MSAVENLILLDQSEAVRYLAGEPWFLERFEKLGWIVPVQRDNVLHYERNRLDECIERLKAGEFLEHRKEEGAHSKNGWPGRRRIQKENDRQARNLGHKDARSMRHSERVQRLRQIIRLAFFEPSERFTAREVSDAIGLPLKAVRQYAAAGCLKCIKSASPTVRKLFFLPEDIVNFVCSMKGENFGEVRSVKILMHPRFRDGTAVTIETAMARLGLSRSGVKQRLYEKRLKRICGDGYRTPLICTKSLAELEKRERLRKYLKK